MCIGQYDVMLPLRGLPFVFTPPRALYIPFTGQNIPTESTAIWNIPLTTSDSSHGGYFRQPDSRLAGEGIHQ
jgi:hypothetical protein